MGEYTSGLKLAVHLDSTSFMICAECGGPLNPRSKQRKFCSKRCSRRHSDRMHPERAREAGRRFYRENRDRILSGRNRPEAKVRKRAYNLEYRKRRPDRVAAAELRRKARKLVFMREYNLRPEVRDRMRKYRRENRARLVEQSRAWMRANYKKWRTMELTRSFRRRSPDPAQKTEAIDPFDIFERDHWTCQLCGQVLPNELYGTRALNAPTVDHIMPVKSGGAHSSTNVRCLCLSCNSRRPKAIHESSVCLKAAVNAT
jgi:hypothetical protein